MKRQKTKKTSSRIFRLPASLTGAIQNRMKIPFILLAAAPLICASLYSAETISLKWGENYELPEGKVLTFKHCSYNVDWETGYGLVNVIGTIQGEVVLFSARPEQIMPTVKVGGNGNSNQTGDPGFNMMVAGPMRIGTFASDGPLAIAHFFQIIATVEDMEPAVPPVGLVPTASVVIPADAAGPVEIMLESSEDMINWNTAQPGLYMKSDTKRFFRVQSQVTTP